MGHLGQITKSTTTHVIVTLELPIKTDMCRGQNGSFNQVVWFDKLWILVVKLSLFNFCDVTTFNDHPQREIAKLGYRSNRKFKKSKNLDIFCGDLLELIV